jgi:hypothetical protein
MANRHVNCLSNWLRILGDDRYYLQIEKAATRGDNDAKILKTTRCYMLNSLANILYILCVQNQQWKLSTALLVSHPILSISKQVSNLTHYLMRTKLRPSGKLTNEAYFILIERLKAIKICLDPIVQLNKIHKVYVDKKSLGDQSNMIVDAALGSSAVSIRLNYFSTIVEMFKDTCEINLNMFFLSMVKFDTNNSTKKTNSSITITPITNNNDKKFTLKLNNYLNSNIVQLKMIKNLIEMSEPTYEKSHLSFCLRKFDANSEFSKKLYLGHLINRNFLQVLINFINRLNDYLTFYVISNNTNTEIAQKTLQSQSLTSFQMKESLINLNHFDAITQLVELVCCILRINYENLMRVRKENFKDTKNLASLFRLYAMFNFLFQQAYTIQRQKLKLMIKKCNKTSVKLNFNLKVRRNHLVTIYKRLGSINTNLFGIFTAFFNKKFKSSLLTRSFLSELIKFTLEIPFNYFYGLSILTQLLPAPLPIPLSVITVPENDRALLNDRSYLSSLFLSSKMFKYTRPAGLTLSVDDSYDMLKRVTYQTDMNFVDLLRSFCLVSCKTKMYTLFKHVCLQLSDLSSQMYTTVLEVYVDFVADMLDEIRLAFEIVDFEALAIAKARSEEKSNESNTIFKKILTHNFKFKPYHLFKFTIGVSRSSSSDELHKFDNEDSIYDTKSIIENDSSSDKSTMDVDLRDQVKASSTTTTTNLSKPNEEQPNTSNGDKKAEVVSPQVSAHRVALIQDFSRLMKFLKDLVQADRRFLKINPVRISFYTLIKIGTKNTDKSSENNENDDKKHDRFLFNLIKMFNQIDTNKKQDKLCKVQETILGFVEFLIRLIPDLFLDQISSQDFTSTITNLDNINHFMIKSILLNMSKLSFEATNNNKSVTITSMNLSSLVLLNKLYAIYFYEKCSSDKQIGVSVSNPIINSHLSELGASLTQLINELNSYLDTLINKPKQSAQQTDAQIAAANSLNTFINNIFYDLLTKFFIYTNSIIDTLSQSNQTRKLKEIFNWSNKSTTEMLIDSISTSDSFTSTVYQHPLASLDKKLEAFLCTHKDDALNRKIRFCLNQSKRLIKLMNDNGKVSDGFTRPNNGLSSTEFDVNYGFKIDPSVSCFRGNLNQDELAIYFRNRSVYIHSINKEELRLYEAEWMDVNVLNDNQNFNVNFDDVEMSYDDVLNSFQGHSIPNSLLTLPIETNLVMDKEFLNKLIKTIEEEDTKHKFAQRPFDELSVEQLMNEEKQFDLEKLNKIKNSQVLNTRTGISYKAPMRGGHANQLTRNISTNSINSSVNNPTYQNSNTSASNMARNDSFRIRAPNTSRPPSLHVDEYYRIEIAQKESLQKQQQQQSIAQSTDSNVNGINQTNNENSKIEVPNNVISNKSTNVAQTTNQQSTNSNDNLPTPEKKAKTESNSDKAQITKQITGSPQKPLEQPNLKIVENGQPKPASINNKTANNAKNSEKTTNNLNNNTENASSVKKSPSFTDINQSNVNTVLNVSEKSEKSVAVTENKPSKSTDTSIPNTTTVSTNSSNSITSVNQAVAPVPKPSSITIVKINKPVVSTPEVKTTSINQNSSQSNNLNSSAANKPVVAQQASQSTPQVSTQQASINQIAANGSSPKPVPPVQELQKKNENSTPEIIELDAHETNSVNIQPVVTIIPNAFTPTASNQDKPSNFKNIISNSKL